MPLETGNLVALLASWWSHSQWQVRHLARNVRLECPGLTSPAHPNCGDCGGRLSPEAVSHLNQLAQKMMDRLLFEEGTEHSWDEIWEEVREDLAEIGATARKRLFGAPPLKPLSSAVRQIKVIRYVACRTVYRYWLGESPDAGPKRIQEVCSELVRRSGLVAQLNLLTKDGSMVWVTEGSQPPHRQPEINTLEQAERAERVARLMGLSGYDQPEDRRENVGLMAVSYDIAWANLRPPTVFDALDNPYFFPGYRDKDHGCVASLNTDFSSPWERTEKNSKIPEWVHENEPVPGVKPKIEVVGFFRD